MHPVAGRAVRDEMIVYKYEHPRWRLVSTPSTPLQRRLVSSRKSRLAHSRLRAEPTRAVPFALSSAERRRRARSVGGSHVDTVGVDSKLPRRRRFRLRLRRGAHPSLCRLLLTTLGRRLAAPPRGRELFASFAGTRLLSAGAIPGSEAPVAPSGASLAAAPMPRPSHHSASGVASLGLRLSGRRMTVPGWTKSMSSMRSLFMSRATRRSSSVYSPTYLHTSSPTVWPSPRVTSIVLRREERGRRGKLRRATSPPVECILCSVGETRGGAVSASSDRDGRLANERVERGLVAGEGTRLDDDAADGDARGDADGVRDGTATLAESHDGSRCVWVRRGARCVEDVVPIASRRAKMF